MADMTYCTRCWLPSTKPYISFDEDGVCGACRAAERKRDADAGIDWDARGREFDELIAWVRSRKAPVYDVLVPVSGGKDSITQVHRVLGRGLSILAVNIDYGIKTEIGRWNLDRVPEMGANLITYRPEQELHKRLIRIGFEDFGDPDLLSHTMLHGWPLRAALAFGVPLVLLGENSAFEYGGAENIAANNFMTRDWFSSFAANAGHDARFVAEQYDIPSDRLLPYDFPDEIEDSDTRAVFSSHFFYWDSEQHLEIAKRYGFRAPEEAREGTYRNYVGIDEKINRIHQYMKVLKFGYGRATDHACEDIRNAHLSREEARELIRAHDLQPLSDDYVDDFRAYLGYTRERFDEIMERWRNRDIWKRGAEGSWRIAGWLGEDE
jgi:N-acetyl sugar amidotransferase